MIRSDQNQIGGKGGKLTYLLHVHTYMPYMYIPDAYLPYAYCMERLEYFTDIYLPYKYLKYMCMYIHQHFPSYEH